jgi:hypothetical protein
MESSLIMDDTVERLKARIAELEARIAANGAEPVEMSPEFTDSARAALIWVLYHHQGGSSPVGQPIRFALGMGAHDPLKPTQIGEALKLAKKCHFPAAREMPTKIAAPVADSAMAKDAERWRWLRDTLHGAKAGGGVEVNDALQVYQETVPGEEVRIYWYLHTPVGFHEITAATLDEAIDEGIAASAEKG